MSSVARIPSETLQGADPLHVVSGADERFLDGLFVTLASSLLWIGAGTHVIFHILDGGISASSRTRLQKCAARCHPQCQIHFYPVEQSRFAGFTSGIANSRMYYARFLMPSLIPAGKVIYLDADTLVLDNLCLLSSLWRPGDCVLAVRDRKIRSLSDDCPWSLDSGEGVRPYFNTGVMVADLDRWRRCGVEKRAMELAREAGPNCRWYDQTVFNYLFRSDFRGISDSWNWQSEILPEAGVSIVHFSSEKKPWKVLAPDVRFQIWRSVLKATENSPRNAVLRNAGPRGVLRGAFERAIRSNILARAALVPLLLACAGRPTAAGIRAYYGQGPGGRRHSDQISRAHPALLRVVSRLGYSS